MKYLLDTNICVYVLKRRPPEVLERFEAMRVLPFDEEAALAGARLRAYLERAGRRIGDLDSLIAAQALVREMILVTNNVGEFERVPDLKIENWVS